MSTKATIEIISGLIKETPSRIEELVKKYGLPRERNKQFDINRVIHWLIDYYKNLLFQERENREIRTVGEIADLLRRDERWINKLAKEKGLPRLARGRYELKSVVRWYLQDMERELEIAKAGGEDALMAKSRLLKAQANMKEMEVAEKRAEIINIIDVVTIIEEALNTTRQRAEVLPDRGAKLVEGIETYEERKTILKSLKDEVFDNLSTVPDSLQDLAQIRAHRLAESVEDTEAAAVNDSQPARKRKAVVKRHKRRK